MGSDQRQRPELGLDYYMEGKMLVFTRTYLLKRGYCCNSGCRHCPYGKEPAPCMKVNIVGMPDEE